MFDFMSNKKNFSNVLKFMTFLYQDIITISLYKRIN